MSDEMRRVILEVPYTGWSWHHLAYAQSCMDDCLAHRDAPMVGHLLYPPRFGPSAMDAALAWESTCQALVLYLDLGMTHNMRQAIVRAVECQRPVELRVLQSDNEPLARRIHNALVGRPSQATSETCQHQIDTPVFDGHTPFAKILSWRCACGTVGPTRDQVKEAIAESGGR
jgi:hypothetical protein